MSEAPEGEALFRALRRVSPGGDAEAGRARWLDAVAAQGARPHRRWVAGGLAMAAALACLGLVLWARTPEPVRFATSSGAGEAGAWLATGAARELPLDFSEGTRLVMAPGSRGRVEQLGSAGATFLLERGEVRAHVVHREATRWLFRAGPFEVQVTGTSLGVQWDPVAERFAVGVDEGSVVVRGPELGAARILRAGERCVVDIPSRTVQLSSRDDDAGGAMPKAPVEGAATSAKAVSVVRKPPPTVPPTPSLGPSWISFEERGDYDGAYATARSLGFASVLKVATADELLRLGQVSRLSGHPDAEREALLGCRERFPGTDPASVAAYELGRASSSAESVGWFETYLRERPQGTLAREALGRLLEGRASTGDRRGARETALEYLARYPEGPHATLARRALEGAQE